MAILQIRNENNRAIVKFVKFAELCTVFTDDNISNQSVKVKMSVHRGLVKLGTTVATDNDISNQAAE